MASNDRSLAVVVTANLSAMKAELAKGDAIIATTAAAMKNMGNAFDGSKVVANANAAMLQVQKMGGITGLTEAEQRKLNATLQLGIDKYAVMGRQAPPDMLKLRDATAAAIKPTTDLGAANTSLMGSLKGVAGMMGLAFGGAAVIAGLKSLVSNTFAYAETIKDTSTKMGVSMEATQRWKFAAEQTGASLENVSKSVLKLSQGIAGDDKALKKSLEDTGVQFESLKSMKPEDAFNVVAEAIAKIPDPMLQADLALQAFGRSGTELLPALREGFVGLSDGVKVMSDDTINRLDAAKDAWQAFGRSVTIYSGEVIGGIMSVSRAFLGSWQEAALIMRVAGEQGMTAAIAVALGIDKAKNSTKELTAEQKAMDAAFDATFKKQNPALDAISTSTRKVATETKNVATEVKALGIIWSGSFSDMTDYAKRAQLAVYELGQALVNTPAPPSLPVSLGPIDITKLGQQLGKLQPPPEMASYGARLGAALSASLSQSLAGLGGVIIGALQGGGNAFAAAGASIFGGLGATFGASLTSSLGKVLGSFAGPLGTILGGLAGGALDKLFGGNQGRDDAKAFASTFGGFNALRQEMLKLGDEGDKLWIALTQNTKGPAAVAKAIKDIEDAFKRQGDAAAEAAKKAEDAMQREADAVETARAAIQVTIDDLQAEYDSLANSVANEMPEEIMGITEANTRAAMAALLVQKKAAEDELERSTKKVLAETAELRDDMSQIFKLPFKASIVWDIPPFPYGGGGSGGGSGGGGGGGGSRPSSSYSYTPYRSTMQSSASMAQTIEISLDGAVITRQVVKGWKPYLRLRGKA